MQNTFLSLKVIFRLNKKNMYDYNAIPSNGPVLAFHMFVFPALIRFFCECNQHLLLDYSFVVLSVV
jgi:hypothetical protein